MRIRHCFQRAFFSLIFFSSLALSGKNEDITPSLLELLDLTGVEHDGSLASIVHGTQRKWLRSNGIERWEVLDLSEDLKEPVLQLADRMGFLSEVYPSKQEYDYCLILGATFRSMELRLEYALDLWKKGIRFKNLVFLTGQRPLDSSIEPVNENCKTESEAARLLWKNAPISKELAKIPVTFIEVPMYGAQRPTTEDTILAWLRTGPDLGSTLFISSQPYLHYQDATAKLYMPKAFTVETVAPKTEAQYQNGNILLDSIARWLYATGLNE